jgi:hypothetical protein
MLGVVVVLRLKIKGTRASLSTSKCTYVGDNDSNHDNKDKISRVKKPHTSRYYGFAMP